MSEGTIMLVGRHRKNLELLAATLEGAGYRTEVYTSLPPVGESSAALLVYDITVPTPGICTALEPYIAQGTKVMLFLPASNPSLEHRCREKGVQAIFTKPISRVQLLEWTALLLTGG